MSFSLKMISCESLRLASWSIICFLVIIDHAPSDWKDQSPTTDQRECVVVHECVGVRVHVCVWVCKRVAVYE